MSGTNKIEEKLDKHLSSPLPFFLRLKKLILGKEKPDSFTLLACYIGFIIGFVFIFWSALSLFVIGSRDWMFKEKKINLSTIINERGNELGFEGRTFLSELISFHLFSVFCWSVILIGICLQYRKNLLFVYFIFGGLVVYLIGMWIFFGFTYWIQDTTGLDKSMYFLILVSTGFHFYYLKQEMNGGFKGMFHSEN